MPELCVLVPSRGRPANIERLVQAMHQTCRGDTHLLLGLDRDDPELYRYLDQPEDALVSGEVEADLHQVVPWLNHLALAKAAEYPYLGHFGDDNLPRTVGWDVAVMAALREVPMCYADDLYHLRPKGSLCCHIFMRSQVVGALGYFGPPQFGSQFVDNVWLAWGRAIGIRFLDQVVIEHLHPGVGKAPMDPTYERNHALHAQGQAAYQRYLSDPGGLARDLERLRQALAG
jgi:hypothetical protein